MTLVAVAVTMEVGDLALLLNNEVATVLAALRGWAAASTRYTVYTG